MHILRQFFDNSCLSIFLLKYILFINVNVLSWTHSLLGHALRQGRERLSEPGPQGSWLTSAQAPLTIIRLMHAKAYLLPGQPLLHSSIRVQLHSPSIMHPRNPSAGNVCYSSLVYRLWYIKYCLLDRDKALCDKRCLVLAGLFFTVFQNICKGTLVSMKVHGNLYNLNYVSPESLYHCTGPHQVCKCSSHHSHASTIKKQVFLFINMVWYKP